MYNPKALNNSFMGLVGWRQPYDPKYPTLPPMLLQSDSNIYMQDVHPLCSNENIYNTAPEFSKFTYPDWSALVTYYAGQVIKSAGSLWRARRTVVASATLPTEGDNWNATTPLAQWIIEKQESAAIDLINAILRRKRIDSSTKSILSKQRLFDGIGSQNDRIIAANRLVGLQIQPTAQTGLCVILAAIGLQLDGPLALPLYLYHSSQKTPLLTWTFNANKSHSFQWQAPTIPVELRDGSLDYDSNGSFYLCYYEQDLAGVQAYYRKSDWDKGACYTCNATNFSWFQKWSKHIVIRGFSIASSNVSYISKQFPDVASVIIDSDNNFGFNLDITTVCDVVPLLVQSRGLLSNAYAMQIALKMLNEIAYTTRMNHVADKTKILAMADLVKHEKSAFAYDYERELDALNIDFSGMSSECLPCTKRGGVKYGAI